MKKLALIASLALVAALALSCGDKNTIHINAVVDELKDQDSVSILMVDYGSSTFDMKKYPLQNGVLDLTLPLDRPRMASLRNPANPNMSLIGFPVAPGEKPVIRGSFDDFTVTGGKFYEDYAAAEDMMKPFSDRMTQLRDEFNAVYAELSKDPEANKEKIESEQERLSAAYEAEYANLGKAVYDYIVAHPDQEVMVTLLNYIDHEQLEPAIAALNPKVANGRMKPVIDAMRTVVENENIRKAAAEAVKEGKPAPDFTLEDINGKPFTLSSLRGKWVVLDFWGSWCGWCIKGIPDMKKYYEKYAGKFEIVGIDCRDTQEKWKAAVEKHELPWLHVYNSDADGTPDKYAIEGYPTKIIVDPEGNINKIVIGESEEFYEYLDELFG